MAIIILQFGCAFKQFVRHICEISNITTKKFSPEGSGNTQLCVHATQHVGHIGNQNFSTKKHIQGQ